MRDIIDTVMEKRACERIPVHVEVKFFCSSYKYTGTVKNLSEKGMFITTKTIYFPFDPQFELHIPWKEDNIHVPVDLSRMISSPDSSDGIGVVLKDPPPEYLEFVNSFRIACNP